MERWDDPDHRQPEISLHVVGGLHGRVDVFNREGGPECENQARHHAQTEVPYLAGPDGRARWSGILDDAHVAVLEPPGHPRLLQTLDHRIVELLVGLEVALEILVLRFLVV